MQYFETLFLKDQDIFCHCQCLRLNLDQNKSDDNIKFINYRVPFHTFIKLISYIFRAIDKQVYRKQISHFFEFKAHVSSMATLSYLQMVSVVNNVHGVTVVVKNKW
jgi:hypothetical protein